MISLLVFPFLATVVLVFLHVYFGAFVLKRGIVFIDLALAQWAALGYLVGQWLGLESSALLFLMGFGFTVLASLILTIIKPLYDKINLQEAVIGVVYISASALAIGLISFTGMEGHHLKSMLSGHLLFIQKGELIFATVLYAIVAVFLFSFHNKFLQNRSRKWDFIFYILFGCVVTSSVKMVGILLVFSYLVLPLLTVLLFTQDFGKQIKFSWIVGLLSSILGLLLSMTLDVPPSFCIILVLCMIWIASVSVSIFRNSTTQTPSLHT